MGDEHHGPVPLGRVAVHAISNDAQGVDVETGIGLVEDGGPGVEKLQLGDLVAFLLTTRETLVDGARGERAVQVHAVQDVLDVLDPGADFGGFAVEGGLGGAEEVRHGHPRHLDGVLHRQEQALPGAFVDGEVGQLHSVEGHGPGGDLVLGVSRDGVGEGGLPGAVGTHDRMHLTGVHGEIHALEDLLGTLLGQDVDVEVGDDEIGHGFQDSWNSMMGWSRSTSTCWSSIWTG